MSARRASAFIVLIAVLGLISCSRQVVETHPEKIKIAGAGATFPYPLYKNWIQDYLATHKNVGISYDPVGSGEGVRRFIRQEVDFGASDNAMSDEEMAGVDRGVKLIPATAGIIVLGYNLKGLNGVLKLPRDVYVSIFSGEIKKWDDPRIKSANPALDLPPLAVIPVTRAESSGTTYAFTNHLSAISKDWRDRGPGVGRAVQWPVGSMAVRGNEGVAGRVKITEGSIGYMEYGYAQRAGLTMAALENRAGNFIAPSPAGGRDTLRNTQGDMPQNRRVFFPDPQGDSSYPIVTYSWLLLYGKYPDQKKALVLKDFIKWGITDGQKYSDELGFCSLPAGIRELDVKDIDEIM